MNKYSGFSKTAALPADKKTTPTPYKIPADKSVTAPVAAPAAPKS